MPNGRKNKRRQRVTKAPVRGNERNTIKQVPLTVSISLNFKDCDGNVRPFPNKMAANIVYGDDAHKETRKIQNDQGLLSFPVSRADAKKYGYFRINFAPGADNYVICEKQGEATQTTQLGNFDSASEQAKNGKRFFRLPSRWSFLTSDWAVETDEKTYAAGEKAKKFLLKDGSTPKGVGTVDAPVKATLDPHWQFLKFEYFDRFFGHSDHGDEPVSIPAIVVEGFVKASAGGSPDTRSNWTLLSGGDEKKVAQCLPWIVQAKNDGSPEPRPDKDCLVQFKQPKDTFVISETATSRKLKSLTRPFSDDDRKNLNPCANRLKYYDLPELWKSANYWCRLSNEASEQGFFATMAGKATTKDKPLIFSLDDMVLTDESLSPLKMRQTDRLVVFYHEFLDPASDAKKKGTGGRTDAAYLKDGLYKPGPDAADAKAQAEAQSKAEAKQLEVEERNARKKAEDDARRNGASAKEIKEAGKLAAAKVAEDEEAQKRIKARGEAAQKGIVKASKAKGTDSVYTPSAALLSTPTSKIQADARTDQRKIETHPLRQQGEERQRKIEEEKARKDAEEAAKKRGASAKEIRDAGNKAVTAVVNDQAAQSRIKLAGENATSALATDPEAKARITDAGNQAEAAAIEFPFSDVPRHEEFPNYVSDYPHWSRLIVSKGCLFDVFEKRTTSGDVIGARAAVRWLDTTKTPAGTEVATRPKPHPADAAQDSATFVVQPYYEQKSFVRSNNGAASQNRLQGFYDEWNSPIAEGEPKVSKIGRKVVALLRTSDHRGENEESVLFLYHPISVDFESKASLLNPGTGDVETDRTKWITNFTKSCADRWNGNDTVNGSRAWIVEDKDADPKFHAQAVTFLQRVDKSKAHVHFETVDESKTSFVNSRDGIGELRINAGKDTSGRGFAGAHELGHAGGQPDDYAPSVKGQTGFGSNNTPGAPYILDERAMMKYNRQLRGRTFWYLTEWLRSLSPFKTAKFQVEHGAFKYKVPHYNHGDRTGRNYAHWPVKANVFCSPNPSDAVQFYDAFLYFLGRDEYTETVLSGKPDGMIVVMIKMLFELPDQLSGDDDLVKEVFNLINQSIDKKVNQKRVFAKFKIDSIDRGGTDTFEKCVLHFSPRFELKSSTSLPCHLKVKLEMPDKRPEATSLPTAPAGAANYYYDDGGVNGPLDMGGLYSLVSAGTIWPDTQVHDGTAWNSAESYPDLKSLFDVYYWYDDGGSWSTPCTLLELYERAKNETIKWDTDVKGPGWVAEKHADKFSELLPVLKRWHYEAPALTGPLTPFGAFDAFLAGNIKLLTQVTGEPTDNTWKKAHQWPELLGKLARGASLELSFKFPDMESDDEIEKAFKHFAEVVATWFCAMLGLSPDSTKANYWGKANAYKGIVRAAVNDTSLNPTMSRP